MEKRKNMYEMSGAGDIAKELNEIKKMQEDSPYVYRQVLVANYTQFFVASQLI